MTRKHVRIEAKTYGSRSRYASTLPSDAGQEAEVPPVASDHWKGLPHLRPRTKNTFRGVHRVLDSDARNVRRVPSPRACGPPEAVKASRLLPNSFSPAFLWPLPFTGTGWLVF